MAILVLILSLMGLQGTTAASDGSLVVLFGTAKVSPSSVRINGPRSSTRDRNGQDQVTFDGLPPGQYDVEPVYDGGISGAHRSVTVEAGKTATLVLTPETVGAVQLGAAQETCDATMEFGVTKPGTPLPPGGAAVPTFVPLPGWSVPPSAVVARFLKLPRGCFRVVGGLAPGSYQAFYSGTSGIISTRTFEVVAQQTVAVAVGPPPARLTGRVLYNGQPPARASLRFTPRMNPGASPATATIGSDGRYSVPFAAIGTYAVNFTLDDGPMFFGLGLTSTVTLVEGPNTFDWSVTGGTLVISIKNWDRRSRLAITLQSKSPTYSSSSMTSYDAQTPYPIRLVGQALATYTVSAYQVDNGPAARAPVVVTLDEAHPEAAIELELVDNPGVVTLIDETGAPVTGASVSGLMANRTIERTPGIFPLQGLPVDIELRIDAPGFVPTCGFAKPGAQSITMRKGRPMEVVFARQLLSLNVPMGAFLVGAGSSSCSVPLSRLKYTKQPTAPDEPIRFVFDNFPQGDRMTWILSPTSADRQEIVVPATGPIIIK